MKLRLRKGWLALYACMAAAAPWCAQAQEKPQNFPSKTMVIVVPFPPGGNTDIFARIVSDVYRAAYGSSVIVDNRGGGAGGMVGSSVVANATPDGHMLLMVPAGHMINPAIWKKLPYDTARDFAGITVVANVPTVMVTHPSLPVSSVKEFVALAKRRPGEINYGSSGVGLIGHAAGELFKSVAKVDMVHVAYKGNAPAVTAILGGETQTQFSSLPTMLPHVQAKRLRALAIAGAARSAVATDIPTMAEAGFPGIEADSGFGLFAPGRTPRPIVNALNATLVAAIKSPEVGNKFLKIGAEPVGNTPEQHDAFVRAEIDKWMKVAKAANIKMD